MRPLSSDSVDHLIDRVAAMRHQEQVTYKYMNYFRGNAERGSNDATLQPTTTLNATWREKIVHWSYNVVDHFDLRREVVAISLDYFDRFMATRNNRCTGNMALLCSLTTLHMAIKLHDPKKVRITTLANLSRDQFGPAHMEEMEWTILKALEWKLHPPTAAQFVMHMLCFLPEEVSPSVRKELLELSRYLTELVVCDMYFVSLPKSAIALASILNVMGDISLTRLSAGLRDTFLRTLSNKLQVFASCPQVVSSRERMNAAFSSPRINPSQPETDPLSVVEESPATTPVPSNPRRRQKVVVVKRNTYRHASSSSSPLRRVVPASPRGRMGSSPISVGVQ